MPRPKGSKNKVKPDPLIERLTEIGKDIKKLILALKKKKA